MTRAKGVAVHQRKHRKGAGKGVNVRKDEVADVVEHRVMMQGHDSHYWAPIVDEADAYSDVRVYDAQGKLQRVIKQRDLRRDMPTKSNYTWNDRLFGRVTDDRMGA